MAGTVCQVEKKNIEVIHASDQATDNAIEDHIFLANPDFELVEKLLQEKGYKPGQEIDEEVLNGAFKEAYEMKYGSASLDLLAGQVSSVSITLAGKISALLQSNPHLLPVFEPYILKRIGDDRQVSTGDGKIHLAALSVPTLKNIYAQIHGMVNRYAGRDKEKVSKGKIFKNWGTFKGYTVKFTTPGQMIYKDPSGGLSIIQKATRDYPDDVARQISFFMKHPDNLPDEIKIAAYADILKKNVNDLTSKERRAAKKFFKPYDPVSKTGQMSMEQIFKGIDNLGSNTDLIHANSQDRMVNIFSLIMRGEIDLEQLKNGKLMIYKDYGELRDNNGELIRYDTTHKVLQGQVVKGFKNLIPLKDYTPPNGKQGDFNLILTDGKDKKSMDMYGELLKLVEQARNIDNAAFHYSKLEMKKSVDNLMGEMVSALKLSKEDISELFFHPDTQRSKDILKTLFRDRDKYDLYKTYKETFGTLVSQDNIIANGGVYDLEAPMQRANHWPTIYNKEQLKLMLDKLEIDLNNEITALKEKGVVFKSRRNLYRFNKDTQEFEEIGTEDEWRLHNAVGQLNSVESIKNNMDDYHVDLQHNTLIPLAKDNKHFKRLSTAYDIRNGRRDDGVYFDYLKNIISTIERNNMSAGLVKAISVIKKSKRIPTDEKEGIILYTTNLFKVPFHSSTVKGLFGWSDEGISKRITGMFGDYLRHYTPAYVTSLFKSIATRLSGLYLPGVLTTPITNLSGILQNFNDYGIKLTWRATRHLAKGVDAAKKAGIEKLIESAGIAEFSDFFSRTMVNGIVKVQLEQDISWYILIEMTKYHKNVDKHGEDKARKIFLDEVTKLLGQSDSYIKAEDIAIQDTTRINVRKRQLKMEKRVASANKLVQFSIEKEYEMRKIVKHPEAWNFINSAKAKVAGKYAQFISLISKGGPWEFTMSGTERYIRSVSFLIGIERAYESGILSRHENWWEYTDKKDRDRAVKIGREYTYFSNFGMSTQAVGSYNYNGLGNLVGKFKYWSQQKAGRDIRIFKEAFRSVKDTDSKFVNIKALAVMFGKALKPNVALFGGKYHKKLRKTHPEVAALRTFLTTQVFMTALWDIALGGPLRFAQYIPGIGPVVQGFRQFIYRGMGGAQMKNWTSDVASLMIFPLVLLGRGGVATLFGLDDDEPELEEKERMFTYYMRRIPFMGYLPTLAFDHILALIYTYQQENDAAAKKIVNSTLAYPYIGVGLMPGTSLVKGFVEEAYKAGLDAGSGY